MGGPARRDSRIRRDRPCPSARRQQVGLIGTSVARAPGILKNKVTYPPPLTEKTLKSRLREKLAECEQSPASSRSSSLGSSDGVRGPDSAITVKSPRREPGREHLNGVAMNVRAGSAQAHGSDSE